MASDIGAHLLDSKTNDKISIHCLDQECRDGVFTLNDSPISSNLKITLDDMNKMYYDFNMIIQVASTSRPPFPQVWHIMNMRRVTLKLRKLFFPMIYKKEFIGESVKMNHKNFLEVIKAIENY